MEAGKRERSEPWVGEKMKEAQSTQKMRFLFKISSNAFSQGALIYN